MVPQEVEVREMIMDHLELDPMDMITLLGAEMVLVVLVEPLFVVVGAAVHAVEMVVSSVLSEAGD